MKTYLTEDKTNKIKDTPRIYANSIKEAKTKCPNELKIIGELIEEGEINLKNDINLN